jgi:hypothetical protein
MPASHFDVKPMTGRPKFIVRHTTQLNVPRTSLNIEISIISPFYLPKNQNVYFQ